MDFAFIFRFHALEKEMATHSSVLAWRIPTDRGAWQATVHRVTKASLVAQLVKNPPAIQKTLVRFLGGEDPLEKG